MTKMVQLSDEAYHRLKTRKRKGESFSDVVLRMTASKLALLDLTDLRTEAELAQAEKWIREIDALDAERVHRHDADFKDLEERRRGRH